MKIIISILLSFITLNAGAMSSLETLDFLITDCATETLEAKNKEINKVETEELNEQILLTFGLDDTFNIYSKENKSLFTSILIPIYLPPPENRF